MEDGMAEKESWFGQTLNSSEGEYKISRWWCGIFGIVLIYGFAVLLTITAKAYMDKPPIPAKVFAPDGQLLFTGDNVRRGQEVFLSHGLMSNGTVWGHGSYIGPDFPAITLHRVGEASAEMIALENYNRHYADLSEEEQQAIAAIVPPTARVNRYNAKKDQLYFSPAEAVVFQEGPAYWREYLSKPVNNGGLKANLITDPEKLSDLSAYFSWMAWASVAPRPGESWSYTSNFPYDELVGNTPISLSIVWSAASLVFLLGGIGFILFIMGRNPQWDWHAAPMQLTPLVGNGMSSPSQGALVKFVVVIGLLLLVQTLVGGGVAHYRADPGSFYGFDLSKLFPSSLLRSWHLQTMIFWLATGFATGGLFLSRIFGGRDFRGEKICVNLLFIAFAIVIFGSLLCEWGGLAGLWPDFTFWFGSQGWEYLELGRLWQYLLIVGLLGWFALVVANTWPALSNRTSRGLAIMFLLAAFAIPFFYLPAIFYNGQTHYTVVDTWRFWIIHLWVEGFFELFATTMVALIFIELGFVSKATALRLIFLDGILILMGGIIGTGHHWYFSGMTTFNLTLSGCFSALEIVPLVILCMEAGSFLRTTENADVKPLAARYRWVLRFIMAVGFWNFLGAGVFGFLINMPIISYFEIGTYLTPNHGHAAMFGVFGLLALALAIMVLRQANSDESWKHVEKYIACSFWGFNIGLALMLILSLIPQGFWQLGDVIQNGYWHARSPEFIQSPLMSFLGWLRIIGDMVFILFGAIPFFVAACKTWSFYIHTHRQVPVTQPAAEDSQSSAEA